MIKQSKARSPAKLILSGEYSVLQGGPALAMAINRYAETTVSSSLSKAMHFNLLNLQYVKSLTFQTLRILKERVQKDYYDFLSGQRSIREVLKKPFELLQYTVTHLFESLNIPLQGIDIQTNSDIPIGCGLGSSAAIIMSTLRSIAHLLQIEIDPLKYLSFGRDAENLQHGYSSGLDLYLTWHGGSMRFQDGQTEKREIMNVPMYLVDTGKPKASTGECVAKASIQLKDPLFLESFSQTTNQLDHSIQENHLANVQECIRDNHQLLVRLGVVPMRVQSFIKEIQKRGAAAKVCGAGSITGDNAGVVLVVANEPYHELIQQYGYSVYSIQNDTLGTHLV